jgi:GT2 family glycosyltransferase
LAILEGEKKVVADPHNNCVNPDEPFNYLYPELNCCSLHLRPILILNRKIMECDIILLTRNHLECTKPCVESILKHTHIPSRLIIIDNGSDEQKAKEYLKSLQGNGLIKIEIFYNETNEGFPRAMNKGLRYSSAPYVCLLNNDTLVTEGWLEDMLNIARQNPQIGILNPSSNTFNRYPDKGESLDSFAERLKSQKGKWAETGSCVGFCMLIKREVIEKIGLLDESFGMAYAEDKDYCRRAQEAGYICARTKGSYVYHIGDQTFRELPGRDELFKQNTEILHKRWGRPQRIIYVVGSYNEDYFQRIRQDSRCKANRDSWVWILLRGSLKKLEMPEHTNIIPIKLPNRFFYLISFWRILKKKKKFDKIIVDNAKFAKVLKTLGRIHKASVIV